MYTKLALVGAAVFGAQSAWADCPLGVEISNVNGHNVDVTITNAGDAALSVFKGNTVLSPHANKDVKVTTTAGNAIPFTGKYFNFNLRNFSSSMIENIPAGGSVTKTVNVASTYELAGVNEITVAALQSFYYQSANSSNNNAHKMSSCTVTSEDVQVTPDQSTAKRDHISFGTSVMPRSRILPRAVTYTSCSSSQTSTLRTAVSDAISMSKAAATAAGNGADYYTNWFKSTSVLSTVKAIFNDVAGVQSTSPIVHCTDYANDCSNGVIAYTIPSNKNMVICPNGGFWGFPMEASTCADSDYDQAGTFLHESTHLYGTDDYAYGEADSVRLTAAQASENADTYELYAASVRLGGCK